MISHEMKVKSGLLFLLLFMLVIGFKFQFLPLIGDVKLLTAIFIICAGFITGIKLDFQSKDLLFLGGINLIYGVIVIIFNGYISYELLFLAIKAIIYPSACYFLVAFYYRFYKDRFHLKIISQLFWVLTMHSVVIIAMFLSDGMRNYIYSISDVSDLMRTQVGTYRIAGFSGGGGALLSMVQGFSILLVPLILKHRLIKSLWLLLMITINIIAIFLTGRTGLIISFLFFPVVYASYLQKNILSVLLRFMLMLIILAVVVIMLSLVFTKYIPGEILDYFSEKSIDRMFDWYTDPTRKNTIELLLESIHLPDLNFIGYLFGSSSLGRLEGFWYHTDIGYLRILYGAGIVGSILLYALYLYLLLQSVFRFNRNLLYRVSIIFLLLFFVLQFKELMLFARHLLSILLIVYFTARFLEKRAVKLSCFNGCF